MSSQLDGTTLALLALVVAVTLVKWWRVIVTAVVTVTLAALLFAFAALALWVHSGR